MLIAMEIDKYILHTITYRKAKRERERERERDRERRNELTCVLFYSKGKVCSNIIHNN